MTGWLLDTNVVSAVSGPKPDPQVARWIRSQPEHSLLLSILTLAEHRKGIANLPRKNKLRPRLEIALAALEARFYGRILSISDPIALQWGAISGEVKRLTGRSPSVIDALLASTAIEHNLYFANRNVAHVSSSGAIIFNPWKDDPAKLPFQ